MVMAYTMAWATVCPGFAQWPADAVPGTIMAMLRPGADPHRVALDLGRTGDAPVAITVDRTISAPLRTWAFRADPAAVDAHALLRAVKAHPSVQSAQFDHYIQERAVPDDPGYAQQWHHQNIQSEAAWDFTTGGITATGDTIVVCIIERAHLPHPDLAANAWYNHAEIPGNGIDDDGNGYVDDHLGWHVTQGDDQVYNGAHGTRVAGMIGARGDNALGVAGANWKVKMMVVHYGSLVESNVVAAYTYPLEMRRRYNQSGGTEGAFVVATNASWGINNGQPADFPIWCAVYDSLGAQGVLSCGATANSNVNVDVVGDMPTACTSDFLVSVTATDSDDMRGSAAYGPVSIDVAAPGNSVYTTDIGGGYALANGTSFASPLTAGVIGLLYAAPCPALMALVQADPAAGALYVRETLFSGTDPVGDLPGTIATGGRINAGNSMQLIMDGCGGCPPPFALQAANTAIGEALLSWSALPADSFLVRHRPMGAGPWTELVVPGPEALVAGLPPCSAHEFQVAAFCPGGRSGFSPALTWTTEGCCHLAPGPALVAATDSSLALQWGPVMAALTYDLRWRPVADPDWDLVTGITGTPFVLDGLGPCAAYAWQVRTVCGGEASDWTEPIVSTTAGCGACVELDYCPSASTNSLTEWIESFHIGGLDLVSGDDGGYGDHTGAPALVGIGAPTPFIMVPGFSFSAFTEWTRVWVDLDRDGSFNDDDELLFDPPEGSNSTVEGTITVPPGTAPGITRLRVSMRYQAPVPGGCTPTYLYGETEDHCVDLQPDVGIHAPGRPGDMLVYPQPADQQVTFAWPGAPPGPVSLWAGDAAGRTVAAFTTGHAPVVLRTAAFAPGLYHYRIAGAAGTVRRGRFVVAR